MSPACDGWWGPPCTAFWLWFVSCCLGAAIPTHGLWHAIPLLSEVHDLIQTASHSYFYPALETQPYYPHSAWDRGPGNPLKSQSTGQLPNSSENHTFFIRQPGAKTTFQPIRLKAQKLEIQLSLRIQWGLFNDRHGHQNPRMPKSLT